MATTSSAKVSFKVPQSWDTNKPKFDGESSEDLLKFLEQVAEVIEQSGLKDSTEKKNMLVKFLDSVTIRDEWKSLDTWKSTSTYDEFLEEIRTMYPELQDITTGSIERLKAVAMKYSNLSVNEYGKIKRFGVSFTLEAKKLEKPPQILTNASQVELYLSRFEPGFREEIQKMIRHQEVLADQNAAANPPPVASNQVNRRDSTVPLAQVIKVAESMANHSLPQVGPGLLKVKQEMDHGFAELRNELRQSRDREALREKKAEANQAQIIRTLQQLERGPAPHQEIPESGQSRNNNQGQDNRQQQRPNRPNEGSWNRPTNDECHYCLLPGHYINDCPHKAAHIDNGRLSIVGGRTRLGDGSYIPREPFGKSQRQKVDEHYERKMGQNQGAPPVQSNYNSQPQMPPGIMHISQEDYDNQFGQIDYKYDTTQDELRSLRVQNQALRNNRQNQANVVQQNMVATPRYEGVPAYPPYILPAQQPQMTIPPILNPTSPAAQSQTSPEVQQFISGIEYGRRMAMENLPATQNQFITTRQDVKDGAPAPPGF
jgi:hypothetical protein